MHYDQIIHQEDRSRNKQAQLHLLQQIDNRFIPLKLGCAQIEKSWNLDLYEYSPQILIFFTLFFHTITLLENFSRWMVDLQVKENPSTFVGLVKGMCVARSCRWKFSIVKKLNINVISTISKHIFQINFNSYIKLFTIQCRSSLRKIIDNI